MWPSSSGISKWWSRLCQGLLIQCGPQLRHGEFLHAWLLIAGEKNEAFRTARAALTKSGTSTLELALAGVPMVAAYKVSLTEEPAARLLVNVPSVILANLTLGENIVPEFIQWDCTAERLTTALLPLLADTPERRRQIDAFAGLDAIMEIGTAQPGDRAAALVFDCATKKGQLLRETGISALSQS